MNILIKESSDKANALDIAQGACFGKLKNEQKLAIVELVRRFGGAATDAVLDPVMQIFTEPSIYGFISYRLNKKCVIIFGDPICRASDKSLLSNAFHLFMEKQGKSITYIGASEDYAKWAIKHTCHVLIGFGKELILDPSSNPRERPGTHGSLVRRKVKQAVREGVTVLEYLTSDPMVELGIKQVGTAWVQGRQGLQLHISNVYLFDNRLGKRWFYAKQGEHIIGVVSLNQLQEHKGWLLNHLMVIPDAPKGTSELLVISALEALEKEECKFVSVGIVAAAELGEIIGLGKFSTWITRNGFMIAKKIIQLEGLNTFWGKFHPESKPLYILFSKSRIGFAELTSLKLALSGTT